MEKHTKHFEDLQNSFEWIERYSKCHDTDISEKVFKFMITLIEVCTNFHSFGKLVLMDEELPIVQGWINKLLANYSIPRKVRGMIAEESVLFASMIESVSNSHISTINK